MDLYKFQYKRNAIHTNVRISANGYWIGISIDLIRNHHQSGFELIDIRLNKTKSNVAHLRVTSQ